jgi:stage V sporulation protein R
MMQEQTPQGAQSRLSSEQVLKEHTALIKEFAGSRASQEKLIAAWQREIEEIVQRICPLDFFPQRFELVNLEELQIILAREGFPRRYEHYRFGQNFENQATRDSYGLGRTYELVINTNPCVAYLLDTNSAMETRLVMAHVYFHNIFFKHNQYFSHTDRGMLHTMGEHAERIKRYQDRYGYEQVEKFLDTCHSLSNLIDIHSVALQRVSSGASIPSMLDPQSSEPIKPTVFDAPEYLQRFVNPPEALKAEVAREAASLERQRRRVPPEPVQDILLFLMQHAPLDDWQRDVMSIVRDEAYYFAPQRMTQIMNEGWASFWHSKMMTEHLLPRYPAETIDYCEFNASILAPWGMQGINPYRLGAFMFRDIEERWNKGMFGDEWENCRDMHERAAWDKNIGQGLAEICQAISVHNDLTFISRYLTAEFCAKNRFFVSEADMNLDLVVSSREFDDVRQQLISQFANLGQPKLSVIDANFENSGELLIFHAFDGRMLDLDLAEPTCYGLYRIWERPVSVLTKNEDAEPIVLTFDRSGFKIKMAEENYLKHFTE